MALNINLPNDSTLISQFDDFLRETRRYINDLGAVLGQNAFTLTNLTVTNGILNVLSDYIDPRYADLSNVNLELVVTTAASTESLSAMYYGTEGQIKVFIVNTDNLTFLKEDTSEGYFDLNSPDDFEPKTGDIIIFINIGGDGGNESHGYWKELTRILKY